MDDPAGGNAGQAVHQQDIPAPEQRRMQQPDHSKHQ